MSQYLSSCKLCPRKCGVNRLNNELGFCKSGKDAIIYSHNLHHGEEPPISGTSGSGTIFFSHCNSHCVYCQNYQFSQEGRGRKVTEKELAEIMLSLQQKGAHNINLVTPTHFAAQIIDAVYIAKEKGLHIPIVYNTLGYELPETLKLLENIVDIYLVDMRYSDNSMSKKHSDIPDYVSYNRSAVRIMHKQKGDLAIKKDIAEKGLIIRILVIPNQVSGSKSNLEFIKNEISINTYISLMSQYHPAYNALKYPKLSRQINRKEYKDVQDCLHSLKLENGWIQEPPTETDRQQFFGVNF